MLVKTDDPQLFINAAKPDGRRVRRTEEDKVFETLPAAQRALVSNGDRRLRARVLAITTEPKINITVVDTGKLVLGKTVEIRCEWRGEDGKHGKRCPETRVIKTQDRFQVKYCVKHQMVNRRRIRNAKARRRTAAQRLERDKAKSRTKVMVGINGP